MRKFWPLLLLAACKGGGDAPDEAAQQPGGAQGGPPAATAAAAASNGQLEGKARAALSVIVRDPKSIRFGELKPGAAGAICGRVETRQPDGKLAVHPFVVTPESVAVISTTPQVNLTDPEDPFPDFYIRWCATPAELARLQPSIVGGETLGIGAPPPDIPDVPPDLPADLPPLPVEAVKDRPAAQAKAEPPPVPPAPTGEDSFFNAVARPGKER